MFLSPLVNHWIWDLCAHIWFSLSNNTFNSCLKWSTSSWEPPLAKATEAFQRSSFFLRNLLLNTTKMVLAPSIQHLLTLLKFGRNHEHRMTPRLKLPSSKNCVIAAPSANHISLNLNGFRFHPWDSPFGSKINKIGLWSDSTQCMCRIEVAGYFPNQSWVASPLSNLSQMMFQCLLPYQVNSRLNQWNRKHPRCPWKPTFDYRVEPYHLSSHPWIKSHWSLPCKATVNEASS